MILLDTNILSETISWLPNPIVTAWIDQWEANEVYISSMTVAEMLFGLAIMPDGARKMILSQLVNDQFAYFEDRILAFDKYVAQKYAQIQAERRKSGRPISPQDAVIAAVAMENDLDLVTRNVKDFAGISGLKVINPWDGA